MGASRRRHLRFTFLRGATRTVGPRHGQADCCLCGAGGDLAAPPLGAEHDPWAWLVWGRELAPGGLDTTGGPPWEPLPVVFTTLVARLEDLDAGLPAALWIVVARTGALLALAMAFRLASRLARGGLVGAIGGAVAAVALFLTPDWFQFTAHGSEAPIAVALMLWAIDRQLDGRHTHVVVLGTLACLLRPELFSFLAVYGLWAWWTEPRLRQLLIGVLVLMPVAWVMPEWIGSGNPLDGGRQARSEPMWSLSLAARPWLRALERVDNHAGLAVELLSLFGAAWALVHRRWAVVASGAAPLAEVVLFLAMTESGHSGNPRDVLPAIAVASVLAGVGASALVEAGGALPAGSRRWPSSPCWAHRFSRNAAGSSAPRRARWNVEWTLIATWLGPWTRWAAPAPSRPSARRPRAAPCTPAWPGSSGCP